MDLARGTLTLDAGTTKNGEGRLVFMPPDVKAMVAGQLGRVDDLQRALQHVIPWLFPNFQGAREPNPVDAACP